MKWILHMQKYVTKNTIELNLFYIFVHFEGDRPLKPMLRGKLFWFLIVFSFNVRVIYVKKTHCPYVDDLNNDNTGSAHTHGHCIIYATITESATGTTVTVCGGGKRKRHVYTSTTNSIEIYFDDQTESEGGALHFVMEYGGIITKGNDIIKSLF